MTSFLGSREAATSYNRGITTTELFSAVELSLGNTASQNLNSRVL